MQADRVALFGRMLERKRPPASLENEVIEGWLRHDRPRPQRESHRERSLYGMQPNTRE